MPEQTTTKPIARRQFLRNVLAGAVTGAVVAGIEGALPRPLLAQTSLTPDAALRELMAAMSALTTINSPPSSTT